MNDFDCLDCGIDTSAIGEYYALKNDVWLEAVDSFSGMLCIGCLESRLARKLRPRDFLRAQVNRATTGPFARRSFRLQRRLGIAS